MTKHHIINLSGAPACLGPALYVACSIGELYVLKWVTLLYKDSKFFIF